MEKVLHKHKTGLIEVGTQLATAADLSYKSFVSGHKFCYIFIWDAVKRLRNSNVVSGCRMKIVIAKNFSPLWKWLLKVVWSITQFDKFTRRRYAVSHFTI